MQDGRGRRLGQILTDAALIILSHHRTFDLVALVEEREPERDADITKDLSIFRPVMTVRGDMTVEISPFMKPVRVSSATSTMAPNVLRPVFVS